MTHKYVVLLLSIEGISFFDFGSHQLDTALKNKVYIYEWWWEMGLLFTRIFLEYGFGPNLKTRASRNIVLWAIRLWDVSLNTKFVDILINSQTIKLPT